MTKRNSHIHFEVPPSEEEEVNTHLRWLKIASGIEATTLLLLLCIAVPLKHLANWPLGVRVMGPVHGLAFITYIWMAVQVVTYAHWRRFDLARLVFLALIPFGGYLNAVLLSRILRSGSIGSDQ
nr:DUF3817 domain-containing protein [Alcaligenes faecalis]